MNKNRIIDARRYSSAPAPSIWVITIDRKDPIVLTDSEMASLMDQAEAAMPKVENKAEQKEGANVSGN